MVNDLGPGLFEVSNCCSNCGSQFDRSKNVADDDHERPEEGTATLCLYCGEWSIFNADMSLRKPTSVEAVELATDSAARSLRACWERSRSS